MRMKGETAKERYHRLKSEGRCTCCGKLLEGEDKNYVTCRECRIEKSKKRQKYEEKRKQNYKDRKKRLKEQGLCCACGKRKAVDGKTMCETCLEKQRILSRENYYRNQAAGYCVCGNIILGDEKYCPECRAKIAEKMNKYRQKKKEELGEEKYKEEQRKSYEKYKQKWIDEHKCSVCGGKLPKGYTKRVCIKCANKAIDRRNRNAQFKIPRKELGDFGLCFKCGKPAKEGQRLCEKHYNEACECIKKAQQNTSIWRNANNSIFGRRLENEQSRKTQTGEEAK